MTEADLVQTAMWLLATLMAFYAGQIKARSDILDEMDDETELVIPCTDSGQFFVCPRDKSK